MSRIWPKLSILLAFVLLAFPLPMFAQEHHHSQQPDLQGPYRLQLKPVYHQQTRSYSIVVSIQGASHVEAGKLVVAPVDSSKQFTIDIKAPKQVVKFRADYPKLDAKQCFRVNFKGRLDHQPNETHLNFTHDKNGLFCVYTPKVTTPNGGLQTKQEQSHSIWGLLKAWIKFH